MGNFGILTQGGRHSHRIAAEDGRANQHKMAAVAYLRPHTEDACGVVAAAAKATLLKNFHDQSEAF